MTTIAKAMTDEEIKAAAEYFTPLKFDKPWITVKEADMVPKTRIQGGMFLALDEGGTEPMGNRIIEMPENTEATEILRNPRSGFIAYVPTGSLKKGLQLVMSGVNGKTTQCTVCHGDELKGIGPSPRYRRKVPELSRPADVGHEDRLASRSMDRPDEAGRRQADRRGMLNIAAYASSRPPQSAIGAIGGLANWRVGE